MIRMPFPEWAGNWMASHDFLYNMTSGGGWEQVTTMYYYDYKLFELRVDMLKAIDQAKEEDKSVSEVILEKLIERIDQAMMEHRVISDELMREITILKQAKRQEAIKHMRDALRVPACLHGGNKQC